MTLPSFFFFFPGQSMSGGMHSIDSDEEDEYEESKRVAKMDTEEDVDGQEEDTILKEGEVKITPFNLRSGSRMGMGVNTGVII